jgi:Omp85 superfamily domain
MYRRLARATICLALLPVAAGAQQADAPAPPGDEAIGPRQAELVAKRKAKAGHLEPYKPNFLERSFLALEKAERPAIYEINLWGAYPRIQTIDHRSQWAAGARLWKPDLAGSGIDLAGAAFWSFQGFQYHEAQLGLVPHRGRSMPLFATKTDDVFELPNVRADDNRRLMLYGSFAYRWAPRFDYWGLGIDTTAEGRVAFRQKDSLFEAVGGYRATPWLTLGARAGSYTVSLGEGQDDELPSIETLYTDETAPGLAEQPDFLRVGAWAVLDTRDVARNPHRGALAAVLWTRYDDREGDAYRFDRFAADGRLYFTLGHRQRVLALRTYFSQDDPAPGARVPFYLQASLGSSKTLRGYESQRFRGERVLLFQGEYRIEAAPAIEVALFADGGTVAVLRTDPLEDLRTDWGVGLRIKDHESVLVRMDAAWGDEGFKFALRFSPAF